MSLLEPAVLEPFTLRIRKVHTARPETAWYNTYEFRNYTATGLEDLKTACENIVSFEQALHRTTTLFVSYTISTWEPDGEPYNPDTFVTVPLGDNGEVSALDQAMPLHICWRVAFEAQTGRQGFRLYRNCLSEGDVESPAGYPTFANPAGMEDRLSDAILAGPITSFLTDGGGIVALYMQSAANARPVLGLSVGGITVKKLNNRYFDRVP